MLEAERERERASQIERERQFGAIGGRALAPIVPLAFTRFMACVRGRGRAERSEVHPACMHRIQTHTHAGSTHSTVPARAIARYRVWCGGRFEGLFANSLSEGGRPVHARTDEHGGRLGLFRPVQNVTFPDHSVTFVALKGFCK